jgi:hypothetical protein
MQSAVSEVKQPCKAPILPDGDRDDRGPGRRQFVLKDLLWLLTIAAVILSMGRLLGLAPWAMALAVLMWVGIWWQYAEIRGESSQPRVDQESLREEVRRWKSGSNDLLP